MTIFSLSVYVLPLIEGGILLWKKTRRSSKRKIQIFPVLVLELTEQDLLEMFIHTNSQKTTPLQAKSLASITA